MNEKLGRSMSAKQVAAYLKIDVKTARKYYRELGGIRIGRRYLFFEEEVYNAIQTWNEVYRTDKEERCQRRTQMSVFHRFEMSGFQRFSATWLIRPFPIGQCSFS